jgi:MFS family permease
MKSTRKIAVIAGVIFILATVTGPLLATPLTPVLTGADYLTQVSAQPNQAAEGVLLWIISAFTGAGIAIAMYPVLKEQNAGLALGAVIFRTIEAVFYMVGVVCLLSLLTLGQQYPTAGVADRPTLQAVGNLLVSIRDHAALLAVFAFCVGAFMYYYLLFQSRLIPRWLSGFGIIAIILMSTACVLALFSGNRITSYIPLAAPIAVQEIVLGGLADGKGIRSARKCYRV